MSLSERQKKHLRGLGHQLKPVIIIGNAGLTDGVREETEIAIAHHELIKLRINAGDREERERIIRELSKGVKAEVVQKIGHVALFYRRNPDKPRVSLGG